MRTEEHPEPTIRETTRFWGPDTELYELASEEFPPTASPVMLVVLLAACAIVLIAIIVVLPFHDGMVPTGAAASTASAAAAVPSVNLDPAWAAVTQELVQDAVASVPAPDRTGLPAFRNVEIDPGGPTPVLLGLRLGGVNNRAWESIGEAAQRTYLRNVLQAIARILPVTPSDADHSAHLVAGVYGTYLFGDADLAENKSMIMWPCQLQPNGLAQCEVALLTEAIELAPAR